VGCVSFKCCVGSGGHGLGLGIGRWGFMGSLHVEKIWDAFQGSGFRVQGLGLRVEGLEFSV